MKFYKASIRILIMLIITVMCFTLFAVSSAAASLDSKGSISLTAIDRENKEPVSGAVFRIYRFAAAHEAGDGILFTYLNEFSHNGMEMGDFSDSYLPVHLMAYAEENMLAYTEKTTDAAGKVFFDSLECGAYLIVPAGIEADYINPSPFIVCIPMIGETQNSWKFDVDASPKIENGKDESNEKTYISVKKQWQGADEIPDSVTVSLIKDSIVAESVVLNSENNWYYRWDDLDKNHSWSVIETDVPESYKVSYLTSQMTVIITNTKELTEEDNTVDEEPTIPPEIPESTTKGDELADTGQLNWPIPVFSVAGLLLFSIGWSMLKFGKKEEDTL